jgi:hypothetical protein
VRSQVFISHSTATNDSALVGELDAACNSVGLIPYLAGREFASSSVTEKLHAAITASDYFVAILTPDAVASPWVNQELVMAKELGKPIIPLLERDTPAPGFIGERDQIRFAREEFGLATKRAIDFILKAKSENDPVFRIQTYVGTGGEPAPISLSILEAVHVHDGSHQLSSDEATTFLSGGTSCGVTDGRFFLRGTFELEGERRTIWVSVPNLVSAGWKVKDDLYSWPWVLEPEARAEPHLSAPVGKAGLPGPAYQDKADSGLPRMVLRTLRDLRDLHGRMIPAGTEGLFVWLPETTPWGEETVQIRIGDKTEVLPLNGVIAVAPKGHAGAWNRTRNRILAT